MSVTHPAAFGYAGEDIPAGAYVQVDTETGRLVVAQGRPPEPPPEHAIVIRLGLVGGIDPELQVGCTCGAELLARVGTEFAWEEASRLVTDHLGLTKPAPPPAPTSSSRIRERVVTSARADLVADLKHQLLGNARCLMLMDTAVTMRALFDALAVDLPQAFGDDASHLTIHRTNGKEEILHRLGGRITFRALNGPGFRSGQIQVADQVYLPGAWRNVVGVHPGMSAALETNGELVWLDREALVG